MRIIHLNKGYKTLVNNEDYEWLSKWKWCLTGGYVARTIKDGGKTKTIYMHRVVNGTPLGLVTDHVNHNKLDNRRSNLRTCSKKQNLKNIIKRKNCSSKYHGVQFVKNYKQYGLKSKWTAVVDNVRLGYFREERHAALARDLWVYDIYGEFASLNFPLIVNPRTLSLGLRPNWLCRHHLRF